MFARDTRVVSIDSDLGTTSGLEAGVAAVDQNRALSVGVAEANMNLMGEAFAALGCHTWVSTFCRFLRLESFEAHRGGPSGTSGGDCGAGRMAERLSEGHALDLTMFGDGG